MWPFTVTFDGSRTDRGERARATAAACLWVHPADGGPPVHAVTVTLLLPEAATTLDAEAAACNEGLHLLSRLRHGRRRARVAGDNGPVLQYCAGQTRLRAPSACAALDAGLAAAPAADWQLDWLVVSRQDNRTAHEAARRALDEWAQGQRSGLRTLDNHIGLPLDPDRRWATRASAVPVRH